MESSPVLWDEGIIDAGSQELAYLRSGSGRPTIVLLHGWPESSWAWRKVIPYLSGYDVIAFDLPGVGRSALSGTGYDKRTLAATVFAGLRGLGITGDVTVVGHDLGALVGYAFARTYPGWTRSLILVDQTLPGVAGWDAATSALAYWHLGFHQDRNGRAGLAEMLVQGKEAGYFRRHIDRFAAHADAITDADIDVYARAYRPAARLRAGFEMFRALPEDVAASERDTGVLAVPVLLAYGEYSQASLLATVVDGLARRGAIGVSVETVADCGHWVPEEQPAVLAGLIRGFDQGR
jgi:pimeloyl-ACP methyl ester carboxylesterase